MEGNNNIKGVVELDIDLVGTAGVFWPLIPDLGPNYALVDTAANNAYINGGNFNVFFEEPFDFRGSGNPRMKGSSVDMGAYEIK